MGAPSTSTELRLGWQCKASASIALPSRLRSLVRRRRVFETVLALRHAAMTWLGAGLGVGLGLGLGLGLELGLG